MENLDELIEKIKMFSKEEITQSLIKDMLSWKTDKRTIVELKENIDKYFEDNLIDNENIYKSWKDFKNKVIADILGMTMNERLYWFSLFDAFDSSKNKSVYYDKLMAKK